MTNKIKRMHDMSEKSLYRNKKSKSEHIYGEVRIYVLIIDNKYS